MSDAAPATVPAPVTAPLAIADALGTAATRLGLLAVPWLLTVTGSSVRYAVAATAALAGPYLLVCVLARPPRRPGSAWVMSIVDDLLAMGALLAVPLLPRDGWSWPVLAVLAAVGALRGLADQSRRALLTAGPPAVPEPPVGGAGLRRNPAPPALSRGGPGAWLLGGLAGAGAGLIAGWLGLAGAVWLVAMAMAGSAALVAVAGPRPTPADPAPVPPRGALAQGFVDLARDRLTRVLAGTLLVAGALLQAAGVILVPAWVRDVLRAPASLGVVGGAALVGMLLARAARAPSGGPDAGAPRPGVTGGALALAAGYLLVGAPAAVGYGHGSHRLPDILLTGALAAGSAAFGLALGATAPGTAALADPLLSADRRARVAGLVAGLALLAVPVGGLAGGWLAGRVGFTAAVAWGAGLASLAVLAPLAGYRAWRHADRLDRSAVPAGTGEVVSVTVGYADGEWTVEIDSGRRRLVGRQAIKPAEALDVVDLLGVPGLPEEVARTVAADQAYAQEHAEQLRGELDQLETRMAAMTAMVELSQLRRATE